MSVKFSSEEIKHFWNEHPVGADFVQAVDMRSFFLQYDAFRYTTEPHILGELARVDFRGKDVLEIGLGQGSDTQRIIAAGARYVGVDITTESIERVRLRCELFDLPAKAVMVMNAETLGFPDESFDIVFSHGVIHHSPRIGEILAEIRRVLRPNGRAVIMVYHRHSANYHLSIRVLRRLSILLLHIPGARRLIARLTHEPIDRLSSHLYNLRREGFRYLKMENFIHKSTDGPQNVFSSVFSRKEARELFADFRDVQFAIHHLNERHFPLLRNLLPKRAKLWLGARYGWHLWIFSRK